MSTEVNDGTRMHVVRAHHEEQDSPWPAGRGRAGARAECRARVDEVQTNLRPLIVQHPFRETGDRA